MSYLKHFSGQQSFWKGVCCLRTLSSISSALLSSSVQCEHSLTQFFAPESKKKHCHHVQRSSPVFHGTVQKRSTLYTCVPEISYQHSGMVKRPLLPQRTFSCHYHTSRSSCRQREDKQTSSGDKNGKANMVESLIETWFYEVCPIGSLDAILPFKTIIKSLPPQDYPDMNKVIIQLHYDVGNDKEVPLGHELSKIGDLYDLKVNFEEDKAQMNISCDLVKGVQLPIVCTLQVPLQFDLSVRMKDDKDVHIQKMESKTIVVETEKGNCFLNNIKSGSVSAFCKSGNITSKSTLLGNIYFHTGKSGSITTDKLQGSTITCETEMGSVTVKSLYADNAVFRSAAGNIHLGHCHGQLFMLADKSDFRVESLEGDLDIGLLSGSVSAHLSKHSKANVEVKTGDISLSFPEGASTDFNLDSPALNVADNIDIHFTETGLPHHKEGHIGEKGKAHLNARTLSGAIHLALLNWIQTTKLVFKTEDDS